MKTIITYTCGHEGIVQLYGKSIDRDRKKTWLEHNALCPDCQKKQREKETQKVLASTANLDLPALTGSRKQIEWASGIRAKKIQEAEAFLDSKLPKEIQGKANQFYHWYISHTEASWWIDHRYDSPKVTARLNRKAWDK